MTEVAGAADGGMGAPLDRPAPSRNETWNAGAGFYLTMALVATAITVAGFAPSFYLKSVIHAPPPLSFLTITHGVVFTAWMALFVTQSALITADRPALHRQLGILGAILFGGMITLGFSTAITAGRLGHAPPGAPQPLAFIALPLMDMTAAAALVAAALWNRRRPDWHKRLMLSAVFAMTGPGAHRVFVGMGLVPQAIPLVFVLSDLLLAIAIAYDYLGRKRVHPAYWAAVAVFAVFEFGVFWAFGSEAWMSFARMITRTA